MRFEGTEVIFLHWYQLINVMGIKEGMMEHLYTYCSLYSHPSHVAVFQFADMFKLGNEDFPQLVNHNLRTTFMLISVFIADYINLFPSVLKTFELMDVRDQIVINFHNTMPRNDSYSINDAGKLLE